MSFITAAALLVALLVAAPIAAHLLRRKQAEERPFPPAKLVPATPPQARRRSALEDRALFAVRTIAVIALAVLGATPFVRCSRLSLSRQGGASVAMALVIDDSLSMRAPAGSGSAGTTRFDRAMAAARELLDGARNGDAIAIVLAGASPRVALAATTNVATARQALEAIAPSDRATDLDEAIRLGRELLKGLPQVDKRVVVLSDLADGSSEAPPLASEGDVATWVPLADLAGPASDCAIARADRSGAKVHVRVVCAPTAEGSPQPAPSARSVEVRAGDKVFASARVTGVASADDLVLDLRADAPEALTAVLTGTDAIAADDEAPVVAAGGSLPIAVIADLTTSRVETGGPPPIEQALTALELDAQIRPLPGVPEHAEELAGLGAMIVDDAPGFTPEVRRSMAAWLDRGGAVLLTLGPRAAAAPLGANFEPLVPGVVRWGASPAKGIDVTSATPSLGAAAASYQDIGPRGRTTLEAKAIEGAEVLARWSDGPPLLLRRPIGRGAVLVLGLPFSTEESDLALRPAFLSLIDRFVSTSRGRGGARRIEVGQSWTFDGFRKVAVKHLAARGGSTQTVQVVDSDGRPRATPPLAGLYEIDLGDEKVQRVAAIPEREVDFRPRAVAPTALSEAFGGVTPSIDASPYVAIALLALLAAELLLRTLGGRPSEATAPRP